MSMVTRIPSHELTRIEYPKPGPFNLLLTLRNLHAGQIWCTKRRIPAATFKLVKNFRGESVLHEFQRSFLRHQIDATNTPSFLMEGKDTNCDDTNTFFVYSHVGKKTTRFSKSQFWGTADVA